MDEQQLNGPEVSLDQYIDQASQPEFDGDSSSESIDVSQAAGAPVDYGLTNQIPAVDPEKSALFAEVQSLRAAQAEAQRQEMAWRQAEQEREYQEFVSSLDDLDPDSRALAVIQMKDRQMQQMQAQLDYVRSSTEQATQMVAKQKVAQLLAQRNGLTPDKVAILSVAPTPEAMELLAGELSRANQPRRPMNAAYMPTGDVANTPARQGPKKHSGDLEGLISSRGYRVSG